MAHLVTLKSSPRDPDVVYLCTPQDMATTMGGFGPARYVGNTPPVPGASYVISTDDLPRFRVYCTNRSVTVLDARGTSTAHRPYGREAPLPECAHCGQPSRRGARLEHCPNCGTPWDPIEVGAPYAHASGAVITCDQCSSDTPSGFSHCIMCGAPHG
jgi:hypothetical protein